MHYELWIDLKFNFKIQQYQTDAVDAVINVFNGTCFHLNIKTASAQIFYKGRGELYVVLTLQGLNVVQKLLIRKFNNSTVLLVIVGSLLSY